MDELYKNLTSVVTGAAALAAVLVTAAATKNAQIYDYLIISTFLIAFPYIPIHVLRARSLVAAAERDLSQFQTDLDLSAQELGFPLQILDVGAQIEGSSDQLRERVAVTVFWLGVMIVLSVATALVSYHWGQSSIKTLLPAYVVVPLILGAGIVPGGMLLSFWRQHRWTAPRA